MKLAIMLAVPAVLLSAGAAAAQVDVIGEGPGAQVGVTTESAAVSYGDLDLRHADGQAMLDRRIATAVDRICGDRPLAVEVRQQQQYSECRQRVASNASVELAALYSNQSVMRAQLDVPPWPGR
jgi:UrcA family protein